MDDTQIIELFWSRNESAIQATTAKYGRLLYSIAWQILGNHEDCEECVNDVCLKAWQTIPPQVPSSLTAYLGRIVRNLSINRWHAKHAQKRYGGTELLLSELGDCIPSAETVEQEVDARELAVFIGEWLTRQSKDNRILFMRRYWFGDSLASLSLQTGTAANKLTSRLYRLRQDLKKALEKEGITL
ncbi:MAG: sigma-70 family RNA polymerase sigma factor [Clostridiaceae bacterium]|nr:sigma-70 family RNA polymerase sigma factor [Clostridiaceae bacterium]